MKNKFKKIWATIKPFTNDLDSILEKEKASVRGQNKNMSSYKTTREGYYE